MIYDENLINDLINSHGVLFRRLNQINNNNPYELHNKALEEGKRINSLTCSIKQNEIIVSQSVKKEDLACILKDCVGLLNQINIDDHLLETYANVLMNAESILDRL